MYRVTSLFLFGVLLLNLFGFYAEFVLQQSHIKSSVKEALASSGNKGAITFTFTEAGFKALHWNEPGEEFTLNGELFDVITVTRTSTGYNVTARDDNRETSLVKGFISLFKGGHENESNAPVKNMLQHLQQDYIAVYQHHYSFSNLSACGPCRVDLAYPPSSFVTDNFTPPPQFRLV